MKHECAAFAPVLFVLNGVTLLSYYRVVHIQNKAASYALYTYLRRKFSVPTNYANSSTYAVAASLSAKHFPPHTHTKKLYT